MMPEMNGHILPTFGIIFISELCSAVLMIGMLCTERLTSKSFDEELLVYDMNLDLTLADI
jgi:hypothetical protein